MTRVSGWHFDAILAGSIFAAVLAAFLPGQSRAYALFKGVSSAEAGGAHSCAVVWGAAVCWGHNFHGQLGDGTATTRLLPVLVSGLASGVTAVAAGDTHTCALVDGGVKCWGSNAFGQLGDGTMISRSTPVSVIGLGSGVSAIAAGGTHTCALLSGGGVKCWGRNDVNGQVGDGTLVTRSSPVDVFELASGATAIAAGGDHTCALVALGGVKCWGDNSFGQVGDGTLADRHAPVFVQGFTTGAAAVAAGGFHTCIRLAGSFATPMKCWGRNDSGQLGDGTTTQRSSPVDVQTMTVGAVSFSLGRLHSCALRYSGGGSHAFPVCWGNNDSGQLGDGTRISRATPVVPGTPSAPASATTAGGDHTCVHRTTNGGTLECSGDNLVGQLGDGTTQSRLLQGFVLASASRAAADFNGDGRSDIPYRNEATGAFYRLLMDGLAGHSGALAYTEPDTAWKVVAEGDLDASGTADLVWRNDATGQVFVQLFNSTALPYSGATIATEPDPAWRIVLATDLDGDGDADIVWRNSSTGQVHAMLMSGTVVPSQGLVYTEPDTAWKIVAAGDFAGSGTPNQLLWRNASTGQVYLMTVHVAGGLFGQSGAMIFHEPNVAWKILAAADFDGDGKSDILWRNASTGQVYVMLMNGGLVGSQATVHVEANLAWKIVAAGDYDGDGKADLLWRNESTGQVYLMLMNGLSIAAQATVYSEPNLAWKILGPWEWGQSNGAFDQSPGNAKSMRSTFTGAPLNPGTIDNPLPRPAPARD